MEGGGQAVCDQILQLLVEIWLWSGHHLVEISYSRAKKHMNIKNRCVSPGVLLLEKNGEEGHPHIKN